MAWWGKSSLFVFAVASAASASACTIKPINTNNGGNSGGSSCSFTLSGAVSASSVDCGSAIAVQDTGFWQISITQVGSSTNFSGFNCILSINGNIQTGTFTNQSFASGLCMVDKYGDSDDYGNDWQAQMESPDAGTASTGSVSVNVTSLTPITGSSGDTIHGSATLTMIGQGTVSGTVNGTVNF